MPGGRLVFDVVSVPDRVAERGGDLHDDYGFVATPVPYGRLLEDAGFTDIGEADTTPGYVEVARRWLEAVDDLEPGLREALGDDVFEDKMESRRSSFDLLLTGELGRTLYWATA